MSPHNQPVSIVADGRERLRNASRYHEVRAQLRAEILARRSTEWTHASRWRQVWLRLEIERELSAELAKRFPQRALYFAGGRA